MTVYREIAEPDTGQFVPAARVEGDGTLQLLPYGYDPASKTLTLSSMIYRGAMPLAVAVETINDLLSEFCFADGDRSKAVAVAAL